VELQEDLAVNLIHARNLIDNKNSISEIIDKLKNKVNGESVDVISAKLLNLQQIQIQSIQIQKVEKLAKTLEGAYINYGLSSELATQYSKTHVVKAMTKNCTINKIKLIMGGLNLSLDDAMSKFVNSCTDAAGQSNTVLFYNRSNRGNYLFRGNFRSYNTNNCNRGYYNNNRGRGQNRGNNRGS